MKNIKEIHTFGTSFTAGGGYNWDLTEDIMSEHPKLRDRFDKLHSFYDEEPKTKFHYSWPGQLQALLSDKVKVFNHAKEGFGNESMYRITNDFLWDGNEPKNVDDRLFIYEFSGLGRKEFWSNTINDYCVLNYGKSGGLRNLNDIEYVGINQDFRIKCANVRPDLFGNVVPIMKKWIYETVNLIEQMKLLESNNHMFIDSLLHHNVNFYIVSPPEYPLDKIEDKCIKFNGKYDFVEYIYEEEGLQIENDIKVRDKHLNLKGNKIVAQIIYDNLMKDGLDV